MSTANFTTIVLFLATPAYTDNYSVVPNNKTTPLVLHTDKHYQIAVLISYSADIELGRRPMQPDDRCSKKVYHINILKKTKGKVANNR